MRKTVTLDGRVGTYLQVFDDFEITDGREVLGLDDYAGMVSIRVWKGRRQEPLTNCCAMSRDPNQ